MLCFADACVLKIFIYMMICCMHVFIHKLLVVVSMWVSISLCIVYICCTRQEIGEFILIKIKLNSYNVRQQASPIVNICDFTCGDLQYW